MSPALHIACASDERYAPFCAVMLHTLLLHNPAAEVVVHYLQPPEFRPTMRDRFARLVEKDGGRIQFHAIPDERVAGLPAMRRIERMVWYRCFLPELVPELDRILYLDADTMVVRSLEPLFAMELGGNHIAAVRNVMKLAMREKLAAIGLPVLAPYFNSGVMLMNLAAWRRDDTTARLLELGRRHASTFVFGDQDALNMLLQSSCLWLHPRWNCQNSFDYWAAAARELLGSAVVDEALREPAILHFEGPAIVKPWHYLSRHPYKAEYWRHLRATGFPVPPIEGLTLRNVVQKHAPWLPVAYRAVKSRVRPPP